MVFEFISYLPPFSIIFTCWCIVHFFDIFLREKIYEWHEYEKINIIIQIKRNGFQFRLLLLLLSNVIHEQFSIVLLLFLRCECNNWSYNTNNNMVITWHKSNLNFSEKICTPYTIRIEDKCSIFISSHFIICIWLATGKDYTRAYRKQHFFFWFKLKKIHCLIDFGLFFCTYNFFTFRMLIIFYSIPVTYIPIRCWNDEIRKKKK